MEFQFKAYEGFHFAKAFAAYLDVPETNERILLPQTLGEGFIQEVQLQEGMSLCIHQYKLHQPFILRLLEADTADILTLKFDATHDPSTVRNTFHPLLFGDGGKAVEIGTGNLFAELKLLEGQVVNFLVITVTRQVMLELLRWEDIDHPVQTLLKENPSFVLHENLSLEMEKTLKQLSQIDDSTRLAHLLYETKVRELIYLIFTRLMDRTANPVHPIHQADAEKIYTIRTKLLSDLGTPPHLPELARSIGMSETKMKQIFRQIFGDSIYNYYQAARMDAAAALLKKLSVSETGYQLGFTNMSHFTRLFEKHHRIKPKKFRDSLLPTAAGTDYSSV